MNEDKNHSQPPSQAVRRIMRKHGLPEPSARSVQVRYLRQRHGLSEATAILVAELLFEVKP